jgi:hypothetical protein
MKVAHSPTYQHSPPSRPGYARSALKSHVVDTFSHFSAAADMKNSEPEVEKTQEPPKSWAEALGAPKTEPKPAWGGTAAPWAAAAGVNGPTGAAKAARDPATPLPFEQAIQEMLKTLDVTAPAKEMKKRWEERGERGGEEVLEAKLLLLMQRTGEPRQHVLPERHHAIGAGLSAVLEVRCRAGVGGGGGTDVLG